MALWWMLSLGFLWFLHRKVQQLLLIAEACFSLFDHNFSGQQCALSKRNYAVWAAERILFQGSVSCRPRVSTSNLEHIRLSPWLVREPFRKRDSSFQGSESTFAWPVNYNNNQVGLLSGICFRWSQATTHLLGGNFAKDLDVHA